MVLEVMALIKDMNKLINDGDVVRDFTLVDKSSVPPPNVIGTYNRRMFYIYERG